MTGSDPVFSNRDDKKPIISWNGCALGVSYDGQYGYVRQTTEHGNYLNPNTGAEVIRENVSRQLDFCTRLSPVTRKKSRQLKYLALGNGYTNEKDYRGFSMTEIRVLNLANGTNSVLVSDSVFINKPFPKTLYFVKNNYFSEP